MQEVVTDSRSVDRLSHGTFVAETCLTAHGELARRGLCDDMVRKQALLSIGTPHDSLSVQTAELVLPQTGVSSHRFVCACAMYISPRFTGGKYMLQQIGRGDVAVL